MNPTALHWTRIVVAGVGCAFWVSGMIAWFRGLPAFRDLARDVKKNAPHPANPFSALRVWKQHKELFPRDTGTRRRVKRTIVIYFGSLLLFGGMIAIAFFV